MPGFLHDDFLLTTETGRTLFHGSAESAPIVDVHNHLSPADIATDRTWETLSDLWLADDHYKWRAMRLAGFDEQLVTGDADPWDRFAAWAATVPRTIRNPLYAWTHLELRRVFGIDVPLSPDTAKEIWDEANRQLPQWSARTLLRRFKVRVVATTDDPADALTHHVAMRAEVTRAETAGMRAETAGMRAETAGMRAETAVTDEVTMIPTFRPDAAHRLLDDPEAWQRWTQRLRDTTGVAVADLASLLGALSISYARMASLGGRASDHGLACLPDIDRDPSAADRVVRRAVAGLAATADERELVLLEVVALAARLAFTDDSVLQLHLGPLRNVSPRLLGQVGPDAGADVMGDERQANGLARFLGALERDGLLSRTVLYNLNPADNALFAAMAGAFSRPGVIALVQWGPPWWFNDHEGGMRRQIDDLSQIHQLAGFIGMLTDSRSILSMTRHELFRRVLCDAIGSDVEAGRIPADLPWLGAVVRDICVENAVRFFGFPGQWSK